MSKNFFEKLALTYKAKRRIRPGCEDRIYNRYNMLIRKQSDTEYLLMERVYRWEVPEGAKHGSRVEKDPLPFASVTFDPNHGPEGESVWELQIEPKTSDISRHNRIKDFVSLPVGTNSAKYSKHLHKVRIYMPAEDGEDRKTIPAAKGLKWGMDSGKPVFVPPDLKLVADKERSKVIGPYVKRVLDVIETCIRMGAYDDVRGEWGQDRNLKHIDVTDLSDDAIGSIALETYKAIERITSYPPETEWSSMFDTATGKWNSSKIHHSPEERRNKYITRIRNNASKYLRHRLLEVHNGYNQVEAA